MVTLIQSGELQENGQPKSAVLVGLSTDTPKPTAGVGNGWLFLEMDTCKKYLFDADGETWREWA